MLSNSFDISIPDPGFQKSDDLTADSLPNCFVWFVLHECLELEGRPLIEMMDGIWLRLMDSSNVV
jgi:hypothetical protein